MDKVFYKLAELRWLLAEATELISVIAGELALETIKEEPGDDIPIK
jgi:NTP pyrophosphatase (non-canonical NTP hydrolase)